jgi:hypothetical protein
MIRRSLHGDGGGMKRGTFCAALGAMSAAGALPVRELGYAQGRDFILAPWYGEGSAERLERMAPDIIRV